MQGSSYPSSGSEPSWTVLRLHLQWSLCSYLIMQLAYSKHFWPDSSSSLIIFSSCRVAAIRPVGLNHPGRFFVFTYNFFHKADGRPLILPNHIWTNQVLHIHTYFGRISTYCISAPDLPFVSTPKKYSLYLRKII
jgi:hypothetical protein